MSGRTLQEISREMSEIAALSPDDPEVAHGRADDLLIEAIRRLAPYATGTVDEGEAVTLIEAWGRVVKWYA